MEVDIPEAMINEELDRMIRQYEENLKTAGYSDILKRTMKRQMRVK